jgi:lysophospholipase L1-like esterase
VAPETPPEEPLTVEVPPSEPDPGPHGPFITPELHRLRRAAQDQVLGKHSPPGPHAMSYAPVSVNDAFFPEEAGESAPIPSAQGRFVPIENESALDHFHRALGRLASAEEGDQKVRILAYGASHTQADVYPGYLRAYLQSRFGDGGQGFVLLGRINHWYRTLDTQADHKSLSLRHARYKLDVKDEPLGLFGAALVGSATNAYGEVILSEKSPNTRFELHYYRQPQGGDFDLSVDGHVIARIETKAPTAGPAYHAFETTPGPHRIRAQLKGGGPVRLFGITAETANRGIVVDTLGISGARMTSSLRWHEDTWIDAIRRRNPDLVTFAYGTNEATNPAMSIQNYERQVREVLARLKKAAPNASCVLISPFDFPQVQGEHSTRRPVLERIVEAQRRIAAETGCGFWNGYAFMGGAGSMRRWASATPPLAAGDHIHLTRLGYAYSGIAIGDALMRRYDRYEAYWSTASAPPPTAASDPPSTP